MVNRSSMGRGQLHSYNRLTGVTALGLLQLKTISASMIHHSKMSMSPEIMINEYPQTIRSVTLCYFVTMAKQL